MQNLFANVNTQVIKEEVEVRGTAGFYKPGIHKIVDTTIYLYDTEWNGQTYSNAVIEFEREDGAKLQQQLNTKTKSNQKEGQTDLTNFMGYIAICTGREEEFNNLKTTFNTLPTIKFTDKYKKEHDAKAIKIFAGAKYSILTTTELQASDNGIYTAQVLDIRFVFRDGDNASINEIKEDNKDKFGNNYEYWSNPDNYNSKVSIAYTKGNYDNWDDRDAREVKSIVTEAAEYYKDGGNLSEELPGQDGIPKSDRQRAHHLLLDGLTAKEVKARFEALKAGTTDTSNDIDSMDDEDPFGED
jgi:hypothetical protein